MTRLLLMFGLVATLGASSVVSADVDVSVSFRFNELSDHGEWVRVGGYGTVWRPYAAPDWRPFYYGRWVWTSDGWLWESDEPFGWIVSHYGNWYFDDDYGWVWIPGYDWSPARVEWHVTDHEIGWFPLFPPPLPGRPHVRIHRSWMFCPVGVFASTDLHRRVVVRARPQTATVTVYSGAPRFEMVQRVSPGKIVRVTPKRVTVRSADRPFVRVEVSGHAGRRVAVPVGTKYRGVRKAPAHQGGSVTVTTQGQAKTVKKAEPHGGTVRVQSQSDDKVRVTSESSGDKKKVTAKKKVTVKKK